MIGYNGIIQQFNFKLYKILVFYYWVKGCTILYKKIPRVPSNTMVKDKMEDISIMTQRQREVILEFRTPQHPSLGTNNWGGASPLLARNIPEESLEQKYTKLNTTRTGDEIFPAESVDLYYLKQDRSAKRLYNRGIARVRDLVIFKLLFSRKEKRTTTLGSNSKKIWLPRLDYKNRWPQGWC